MSGTLIEIQIYNGKASKVLTDLQQKQKPYVIAAIVNNLAFRVMQAERGEPVEGVSSPTPIAVNPFFSTRAARAIRWRRCWSVLKSRGISRLTNFGRLHCGLRHRLCREFSAKLLSVQAPNVFAPTGWLYQMRPSS
jgi:hypothetical protein